MLKQLCVVCIDIRYDKCVAARVNDRNEIVNTMPAANQFRNRLSNQNNISCPGCVVAFCPVAQRVCKGTCFGGGSRRATKITINTTHRQTKLLPATIWGVRLQQSLGAPRTNPIAYTARGAHVWVLSLQQATRSCGCSLVMSVCRLVGCVLIPQCSRPPSASFSWQLAAHPERSKAF